MPSLNSVSSSTTKDAHEGGTRVWVKIEAVQAARNPKPKGFTRVPSTSSDAGSEGKALIGRPEWPWKTASLLSSSDNGILLKDDEGQVTLDSNALNEGTVLLDNEYDIHVADENSSNTSLQGTVSSRSSTSKYIYPQDLITLTHLHEPAVVHCLNQRYQQQNIYTATGPVLLALNPFQSIRGLYGDSSMRKYWEHSESAHPSKKSLPPHVYAIADQSFRNMMRQLDMNRDSGDTAVAHTCDQSILVSGESGAGKTVTTKYVMKYLAALSQRQQQETNRKPLRAYKQVQQHRQEQFRSSSSSTPKNPTLPSWAVNTPPTTSTPSLIGVSSPPVSPPSRSCIESQVLQSNPILESFGNARTLRNDNSSRFGKFLQLQFHQTGRLLGASIETYLLEKVRLVTQAPGERNYHIFYEMLYGMDARELRQYCLAPTAEPEDFLLTQQSGTFDRRDGVKDPDTYKELRAALHTMKFDVEMQRDIFGVVAAVLHASNLTFEAISEHSTTLAQDNVHLAPVCHLLGVTPEDLNEALCSYHIQAGRDEGVRRGRSQLQAEKGLEALLKATYGALFGFLVRTINESIAYHPEEHEHDDHGRASKPAATIGVLDIFGFESFQTNSFEQLCINYCNEALQQQFNAFVLKNEQEEYEREGIEWSFIEFPENQDVLDLIDKRGSGILNILDDQCRAPGTTDRSFASDVYNKCASQNRFGASRRQTAAYQFEVHHYAGPVEYTTTGFVEKNRDELPKESTELLLGSANPFVQYLAETLLERDLPIPQSTLETNDASSTKSPYPLRRSDSSAAARMTVGGQFRRQLRDLRSKIDDTTPHYIRCLKPNDHLVPDHFDPMVVAEQLRCGGILEAVRVSRAGFTQHYPHADFVRRYGALSPKDIGSSWKTVSSSSSAMNGGWTGATKRFSGGSSPSPRKWESPLSSSGRSGSFGRSPQPEQPPVDYKARCKDLLKVLCRKIEGFEKEEAMENGTPAAVQKSNENGSHTPGATPPSAKSKTYSCSSTPLPSWAKNASSSSSSATVATPSPSKPAVPKSAPPKAKYPPWAKNQPSNETATPTATPPPPSRSGSLRRAAVFSSGDLAKVGIQLGKTKVFLRHKAFEILEKLRSLNQAAAATRLNAIFRRYLARIAYIPVRDAYRIEMRGVRYFGKDQREDFSETSSSSSSRPVSSDRSSRGRHVGDASRLIQRYESEVRASIHMSSSGLFMKTKKKPLKQFKWVLVEGIWVKNHDFLESESSKSDQQ